MYQKQSQGVPQKPHRSIEFQIMRPGPALVKGLRERIVGASLNDLDFESEAERQAFAAAVPQPRRLFWRSRSRAS